jgi:hypothetical protein
MNIVQVPRLKMQARLLPARGVQTRASVKVDKLSRKILL